MVEVYVVGLAVLGVVVLSAALLPELLGEYALSPPLFFVALGALAFALPLGLPEPDPIAHGAVAEKLAEFLVIVSLMGAGLKLDRPFSVGTWSSTWRLLAVTMPLTIAGAALAGWWGLGFVPATALLLGAVVAPTDPVLASDVQVGPPGEGEGDADDHHEDREHENEVPFALTSEAGLNDGLAFPFTYAAILVAGAGVAGVDWLGKWAGTYVAYKIVVGVVAGLVLGALLAELVFRLSPTTRIARAVEGVEALGGTLLIYGTTELVQGYGFIAVFVAALVLRHRERSHDYNRALHDFSAVTERLTMADVAGRARRSRAGVRPPAARRRARPPGRPRRTRRTSDRRVLRHPRHRVVLLPRLRAQPDRVPRVAAPVGARRVRRPHVGRRPRRRRHPGDADARAPRRRLTRVAQYVQSRSTEPAISGYSSRSTSGSRSPATLTTWTSPRLPS